MAAPSPHQGSRTTAGSSTAGADHAKTRLRSWLSRVAGVVGREGSRRCSTPPPDEIPEWRLREVELEAIQERLAAGAMSNSELQAISDHLRQLGPAIAAIATELGIAEGMPVPTGMLVAADGSAEGGPIPVATGVRLGSQGRAV